MLVRHQIAAGALGVASGWRPEAKSARMDRTGMGSGRNGSGRGDLRAASRTIAIAFIAAATVICSVRRFSADLGSPFVFEPDARHHVWWTYRFADPKLFEGDLVAEYYSGTF